MSYLRVLLSAEGAKNVSWPYLSLLREWGSLVMEFTGKFAKSNLATIWLEIANACGSIPHKLIVFALRRYGVSPQ